MSLEIALEDIESDEYVEVTPKTTRLLDSQKTNRRCRGRGSVPARRCARNQDEEVPWDAMHDSLAPGRASLRTRTG